MDRTYVTLDDPLILSLAKTDPALLMQRFPPPVLIDEVQYTVELLPHIKMAADRAGPPGLFGPGGVVCLVEQSLPLTATTLSIPAWMI